MVLSPPAGIVGAVTLFSSPIPSHLFSYRHRRTKEALTPWHNRREGFPVDRHLFKRALSLSLTFSVSELRALCRSLFEFTSLVPLSSARRFPFLPRLTFLPPSPPCSVFSTFPSLAQ
ncbi:uncharacterized protein LOC107612110 [Arachis ipaensis]|uniref:uncharacterized protein LOC107612110 n=1 Tax=Arachis ipaensis TaxID=130454 RepID=UPI0007AF3460|nr:uncharacterized protein LOC107612110 [Arachis ipaensis]